MRYFALSFLGVLLINFTQAQQITFSKVFSDVTSEGINGYAMSPATDSGYVIAGSKGLILKIDLQGNTIWNKIIHNTLSTHAPALSFNSIISTIDTGYFLVGYAYNELIDKTEGLCIKLNSQGDTIWTKTISYDDYIYLNSVYQTNDLGYIISGYTHQWKSNEDPYTKIFIAKLDNTGNIKWSNIFYAGNNSNNNSSIKQISNGNFIASGVLISLSPNEIYGYLICLSPDGSVLWSKKYQVENNSDYCEIKDFVETRNGLVLYFQLDSGTSLIKTDFSGNIIWSKFYNTGMRFGTIGEGYQKLKETSDDGYVIVYGNCSGGGITITDSLGNPDLSYYLMMNPLNAIETEKKEFIIMGMGPICGVKSGNSVQDEIGLIQVDSIGTEQRCTYLNQIDTIYDTIICKPVTFSMSTGSTSSHIPLDIFSTEITTRNGCVDVEGDVSETLLENNLVIYPNPNNGYFSISLSAGVTGHFTIINSLGQKIFQQKLNKISTTIDLTSQISGIYFYKFESSDKKIITGKLLISK